MKFSALLLQKDYGGPLVCQEHERKVIIGVSIQRTKCASSQPALFVNVAFYSEWIYKVFKLYPSLERNWWRGVKISSIRKGRLKPSAAWSTGEKLGNWPFKKVDIWGFFLFGWFVIRQRGQRSVIEDWINQMECHPFFHFGKWRHPGRYILNVIFLQPKFLAHGRDTNYSLTCSEILKPCNQRRRERRLWLSIISWNILEFEQSPGQLPHEVSATGISCFFMCWAGLQNIIFSTCNASGVEG